MHFSLSTVALSLISCVAAADWKTAVGWNGVVSAPTVVGTPLVNSTVHKLSAETAGGVYLCTDVNWGGNCAYTIQGLNTCIVLSSAYSKDVSSFGPDDCAVCKGYSSNNCQGSSWSFIYPGDPTGGLGTTNPWNDKLESIECSSYAC